MKTKFITSIILLISCFGISPGVSAQQWLTAGNNLAGGEKLGSLNNFPLNIVTNNTSRVFIAPNGRVGIGTIAPVNILTVKNGGGAAAASWITAGSPLFVGFAEGVPGNGDLNLAVASNTVNSRPVFGAKRARGTLAAPAAVINNDQLASFLASGFDGGAFQGSAAVDFFADGAPSGGNVPARISFVTGSNSGNRTERLKVGSTGNFDFNAGQLTLQKTTGNVGIGTGNLNFANGSQTIQFPAVDSIASNAMINMFSGGTSNANRMVIAHSPLYQNWGLQYRDSADRFDFLSNGASVMLVDLGNKNVGIGTDAPQRKLHIVNASFGGGAPEVNSPLVVENNTDNYISVLAPSASQRGIYFGDNLNVNDGGIIYDGNTNAMLFRTNGNTNRMSLSSTGNVSIGGNLDIAGTTLSLGSVETLADAGANMISSNSDLIPSIDNSRRLGTTTLRWSEVWATDGTINTSDVREKSNIRDLDYGIKEIMQLRSARFNWKNREDKGDKIGLIAQELQKVLPEVVRGWEYKNNEETGLQEKVPATRLGVAYSDIIPVLIRGMQEQQVAIEDKDQKITELSNQLEQLQNLLIKKGLVSPAELSNNAGGSFSKARIDQNVPNPTNGTTTLKYFLPTEVKKASILITSINGSVVKTYPLTQMGNGQLSINVKEFGSGEYIYTLVINGTKLDSKKLMLIK